MKTFAQILLAVLSLSFTFASARADEGPMRVLAITSRAKDHLKMIAAATPMLQAMAQENHFSIDITNDDSVINDANLANYQVFLQLQEAPFDMKPDEQAALQRFIESGHGWVGIHAAGLAGKQFLAPNSTYWQWFEDFLGGITYSPHPAYQRGTLVIEDHNHPITRGLPDKIDISDEWYEFNESPRPRVHVLAHADESTYHQNKPMGDHPLVWVNERFRRMVYISIGHDPSVCENADYRALLRNAILWAGEPPAFRVVAMAEAGGVHLPYVVAAKKWLNELASQNDFTVDYIENADKIDDAFLSRYQLFIQLNYPPYNWNPSAMAAFTKYIEQGKGGWIGFHHASLLGEFDGTQMWPWFHDFLGQIRWKDYIPKFAAATVNVEDKTHPIMQGVPASFFIKLEEWYTWDKSPRANVHVLASVDESTYSPDSQIKMGDHPVIWSNDKVAARNVYIFMGHSPVLFESEEYKTIFRNAVFWAANKPAPAVNPSFSVLAFYSTKVEKDHVDFANNALAFYGKLAAQRNFKFDSTTNWADLNPAKLANYNVVIWLNDQPHSPEQRAAFENFVEHGGAWLGCHVAGYNDKQTKWPWFVNFLGGGVFYENNWPPLPAKLIVDSTNHPATRRLPPTYISPANEFYRWIPSPRENKDVQVLLTLDPSNYPLGKKDFLTTGDIPVVWTNRNYHMLYINMGHGDRILTDETQNKLFADGLIWLGNSARPVPTSQPAQ